MCQTNIYWWEHLVNKKSITQLQVFYDYKFVTTLEKGIEWKNCEQTWVINNGKYSTYQ